MKNYKQILEAVRRGIKLALDNYQDIESSISHDNDVINAEDVIQQQIDFWSEWVDLGLPSGTLWAKYNLGVDSKNLEQQLDKKGIFTYFGDYYSWGEIQPKKCKHSWESYKFSPGGHALFDKYVSNERFAIDKLDNLKRLQNEDDVAYMKNGENRHIHMPTHDQLEELVQYTLQKWVTDYNGIKNLDGCLFINTKDITKHIFIPAAGCYGNNGVYNIQRLCGIWSSTQTHNVRSDLASVLIMSNAESIRNPGEPAEIENRYRYAGYSIRAIYNK